MLGKIESVIKIIAVVLAGLWTIYIFRYQYLTIPSLEPTSADLNIQVQNTISKDSFLRIKITTTLKNVSKIPEQFPAAYYNIRGYSRRITNYGYNNLYELNQQGEMYTNTYSAFETFDSSSGQYFYFNQMMPDQTVLEPNQSYEGSDVITFPKNRYQYLDMEVNVIQTKANDNIKTTWEQGENRYIYPSVTIFNNKSSWWHKKDKPDSITYNQWNKPKKSQTHIPNSIIYNSPNILTFYIDSNNQIK